MTEQIIPGKSATSRIGTALGIALAKFGSSAVSNVFVGNNNFVSGGAKLGAGLLLSGMGKGKVTEILGAGFLIDGAQDLLTRAFGLGGKSSTAQASSTQSTGSIFI